ncbi:hypothetical protein HS141_07910 [Cetobacterium somerae]|uniref:hypothetical protein n=1 Tax=Cetobacterium somerae TaxID=188913 RepID=UPI00211DD601|nr:hypothetical protein [Cetobacterium somerae]MCQ9626878.1 hypothetical protein [Cetobacterium somerae]
MRDKNLTQNCNKEIEKEVTQIISMFTIEQTVAAEEMTREEYVTSRGWKLPEDEKHLKDEKVFKIYNEEGHISMLPKDLFLKIAKEISNEETITKTDHKAQLKKAILNYIEKIGGYKFKEVFKRSFGASISYADSSSLFNKEGNIEIIEIAPTITREITIVGAKLVVIIDLD